MESTFLCGLSRHRGGEGGAKEDRLSSHSWTLALLGLTLFCSHPFEPQFPHSAPSPSSWVLSGMLETPLPGCSRQGPQPEVDRGQTRTPPFFSSCVPAAKESRGVTADKIAPVPGALFLQLHDPLRLQGKCTGRK